MLKFNHVLDFTNEWKTFQTIAFLRTLSLQIINILLNTVTLNLNLFFEQKFVKSNLNLIESKITSILYRLKKNTNLDDSAYWK